MAALIALPTGNVSLYHHLVGTFMYCSVGAEKALLVLRLMVEAAAVGGERPLVVPLFSVLLWGPEPRGEELPGGGDKEQCRQ